MVSAAHLVFAFVAALANAPSSRRRAPLCVGLLFGGPLVTVTTMSKRFRRAPAVGRCRMATLVCGVRAPMCTLHRGGGWRVMLCVRPEEDTKDPHIRKKRKTFGERAAPGAWLRGRLGAAGRHRTTHKDTTHMRHGRCVGSHKRQGSWVPSVHVRGAVIYGPHRRRGRLGACPAAAPPIPYPRALLTPHGI